MDKLNVAVSKVYENSEVTIPSSLSSIPNQERNTILMPGLASAQTCPDCNGAGFFRHDVPVGHKDFGRLMPCDNPIHTSARLHRLAGLSNLMPAETRKRIKDIKPNTHNGEIVKAAKEMVKNPCGWWLYIYGKAGNAKSDILIAVCNELNILGVDALYIEFTRLLNWISEAYTERDTRNKYATKEGILPDSMGYQARLDRIAAFPVIAIDEFDKARMTDFREEFLFEFLNLRWRQAAAGKSATLFASQTAPIDWADPIRSRIQDGRFRVIHNLAGDARPLIKSRATVCNNSDGSWTIES